MKELVKMKHGVLVDITHELSTNPTKSKCDFCLYKNQHQNIEPCKSFCGYVLNYNQCYK